MNGRNLSQMLLMAVMLLLAATVRAQDETASQTSNDDNSRSTAIVDTVRRGGKPRILVERCVGPINFTYNISNTFSDYGRAELVYESNVAVGGTAIGENMRKEEKIVARLDSAYRAGFDYVIGMNCTNATQTHTSSTTRYKNQTYTYHNYTAMQSYNLRLYSTQSKELVRKGDRAKTYVSTTPSNNIQRVSNSLINEFPRQLRRLINRAFPVSGKVTNVYGAGKVTFSTLDLGTADGVSVGDEFNILIDKVKKGLTVKERLGKGRISSVSEHTASCKMSRGEKKVLSAFKKGVPLYFSDESKPNLDEKDDKDDD